MLKKKRKEKKPNTTINDEFPYIDDVPLEEWKERPVVVIDPGKKSLLTMMDQENNFLSYTNRQRLKETKRLKHQTKLLEIKKELGIEELEQELIGLNSKTCDPDYFKAYADKKIELHDRLYRKYEEKKFRQYKWYSYIERRRSEDKLLNRIEKKYGENIVIVIGDWSIGKQMRNFISTPNLRLKRKLKEKFRVYNIDEFRTSCIHYKMKEKCENLKAEDKKIRGKKRTLHSVLTCKMENKRKGCINRDKNGCKNMMRIVENIRRGEERPEELKRKATNQGESQMVVE